MTSKWWVSGLTSTVITEFVSLTGEHPLISRRSMINKIQVDLFIKHRLSSPYRTIDTMEIISNLTAILSWDKGLCQQKIPRLHKMCNQGTLVLVQLLQRYGQSSGFFYRIHNTAGAFGVADDVDFLLSKGLF